MAGLTSGPKALSGARGNTDAVHALAPDVAQRTGRS